MYYSDPYLMIYHGEVKERLRRSELARIANAAHPTLWSRLADRLAHSRAALQRTVDEANVECALDERQC